MLFSISFATFASSEPNTIRDITRQQVDENALTEAVASRTLSWLTGSSANNDYISVGRMANYFGFVGLRVASGHSLSRSQVAKQTLAVLSDSQRRELVDLVQQQKTPYERVTKSRFAINRALEGLLVGELISHGDFVILGEQYGLDEAMLGSTIAQRLGSITQSLTDQQKKQLNTIRTAHLAGRGHELSFQEYKLKLSKEDKRELTNLAARLLSWSTGSVEYNDFEVVGKPSQHFGFVSLRIESNHGVKRSQIAKQVMELLTDEQLGYLRQSAQNNIKQFDMFMHSRGKLLRELEVALDGGVIDLTKVAELGREVGRIEALMTWEQAQAMLKVRQTLSPSQSSLLLEMRAQYIADKSAVVVEDPISRGRQLYSQCSLCHSSTTPSVIAPKIDSILGAKVAGDSDFAYYSPAIMEFAQNQKIWSESLFEQFIASPRALIPGTYMGFSGLSHQKDREALVKYIRSLDD
ncbi:c-type cytochrome [Vibrio sp. WXL103]|uniref:c-type cytochrome n=1 Tax=Vibrio sp. WXL103 TaxID=3450710 RepID=UPI003EC92C94